MDNNIELILSDVEGISLSLDTAVKKVEPPLENLEITPTKEQQTFTHENSYGYDKVTVEPIPEIKLQDKEVTPTKETQNIVADNNYDGLNQVTIEPIPDEYIIPEGMLPITENTTYDVRRYARVSASVHPAPNLQDKSVTITENGTQNITADSGYDGLGNVEVISEFKAAKYTPRWIRFSSYEGTNLNAEVSNLDTSKMTSFYAMFQSCSRLTSLDLKHFDVSNITNMGSMFQQCNYLASLDISGWGVNKTTNFGSMFSTCSTFKTLDLRTLYTSYGTTLASMFNTCTALQSVDMTGCDLSNVTSIYQMFNECGSLTDVSKINWNMPKITGTGLTNVFQNCKKLETADLSAMKPSSGTTSVGSMFRGCAALTNVKLPDFSIAPIANTSYMFYGCTNLKKLDLSSFDGSKITNTSYMLYNCKNLETLIIDNPKVFKVTSALTFNGSGIASGLTSVYVPDNLVDTYKSSDYWSTYPDVIKPISEMPTE